MALGVLVADLARAAQLSVRLLIGQVPAHRLERWQTAYLPVFGVLAAAVVAVLPPVLAFA